MLMNNLRLFILSPVVLLLGSAIRLLVVSNYDPATAVAVAAHGGAVGTLLGTLIPLVPTLLPLLALGLFVLRMWMGVVAALIGAALIAPAYTTVPEALSTAWNATAGIFGTFYGLLENGTVQPSMRLPLAFLGVTIAAWIWDDVAPSRRRARQEEARQRALEGAPPVESVALRLRQIDPKLENFWLGTCVVLAFFSPVFLSTLMMTLYEAPPRSTSIVKDVARQMWLPVEVIETKTVRYIGYSIAVQEKWHVILDDRDRTIHTVPAEDVTSRWVCRKASDPLNHPRPLIDLSEPPPITIWRVCPEIWG